MSKLAYIYEDSDIRGKAMKTKIRTANDFYNDADKDSLAKLGFEFKMQTERHGIGNYNGWSPQNEPEIDINTLDELLAMVRVYGDIVIREDEIIIYDDYLE